MSESRLELSLPDEASTVALGRRLAVRLRPPPGSPCIIYLQGPLGAGKTTLVRGLLRELGVKGPVRSPTFTLLELYPMDDLTCVHLDLYRLASPDELEHLGLRDLLEPAHVWFVEWPERGQGALPPPDLILQWTFEGEGRRLVLQAPTEQGRALIHPWLTPPAPTA